MFFKSILPNFCCSSSFIILSFGDLNKYTFFFKTFETVVLLTFKLKFSFIKFDNFRDDNELSFSILLIIKLICSLSSFLKETYFFFDCLVGILNRFYNDQKLFLFYFSTMISFLTGISCLKYQT